MLRGLYDWTMGMAERRGAKWALFAVAFAESSFFPIPPDVLMIPMILARRKSAFSVALIALLASVMGALLGYYIGAALFEVVGQPILSLYGKEAAFDAFSTRYNEMGVWAVLIAGVTPFPFKVITIASGVTGMSLVSFVLSAIVARSLRFFVVAGLLYAFGEPIRAFIDRWLGPLFVLFCVLLIGGFAMVKYL